ncbi:MAG: hypothetical protein ACYDGY_09695, partial [Acidimicrobiales bacterium]
NSSGTGCGGVDPQPLLVGASNCSSCSISDHGGPVQASPRVFIIMWGQDPSSMGGPLLTLANAAAERNLFNDLADSGYLSILAQYGVTGYRGLAGIYVDKTGPSGNTITSDNQITAEIHHVLINEEHNPAWQATRKVNNTPWLDTQFVVIPDASVNPSNLSNLKGGCAYHFYASPRANSSVAYVYDLIPDPYGVFETQHTSQGNCSYVTSPTTTTNGKRLSTGEYLANLTDLTSHEFAEAATDPEDGVLGGIPGWFDSSNGYEVADLCENLSNAPSYLPGSTQAVAQLIYSKHTNSCRGEGAGGYWQVSSGGQVFAFGSAHNYGSISARLYSPQFPAKIRGMAATPDGKGYWLVGSNGSVYTFGDAHYYGSLGNVPLGSPRFPSPIAGIASTPDGGGYWLVGWNGSVYTFGDADYYGSATGDLQGTFPSGTYITGIASTPDGGGYWLVDNTGTSYNFGDATYLGQIAFPVNQPKHIIGIQALAGANGFWSPDAFGGLYTEGSAQAYGSLASVNAVPSSGIGCVYGECVSSMAATYEGEGYYLNTRNGFVYPFGVAGIHSNAQGDSNALWKCSAVPGLPSSEVGINCYIFYNSNYPLIGIAVSPS